MRLERVTGIEPVKTAWKAASLAWNRPMSSAVQRGCKVLLLYSDSLLREPYVLWSQASAASDDINDNGSLTATGRSAQAHSSGLPPSRYTRPRQGPRLRKGETQEPHPLWEPPRNTRAAADRLWRRTAPRLGHAAWSHGKEPTGAHTAAATYNAGGLAPIVSTGAESRPAVAAPGTSGLTQRLMRPRSETARGQAALPSSR